MTARTSLAIAALTAMAVAAALLIGATTAFAQPRQERLTPRNMEQMQQMMESNSGMRGMHEMMESNSGMRGMQEMMMEQGPGTMDMTGQGMMSGA